MKLEIFVKLLKKKDVKVWSIKEKFNNFKKFLTRKLNQQIKLMDKQQPILEKNKKISKLSVSLKKKLKNNVGKVKLIKELSEKWNNLSDKKKNGLKKVNVDILLFKDKLEL